MNNNTAIVVSSCDKNQDLWDLFFTLFNKYFPNNPYKTYLCTNFIKYKANEIETILANKVTCWSDELKECLLQIPEENIILFLDDYFLVNYTDLPLLQELLNFFENHNYIFFQLAAFPKKYNKNWFNYKVIDSHLKIGEISELASYRISLQVGIWKKQPLISLLTENMNPWQFEEKMNKYIKQTELKTIYYYGNPKLKYVHGPFMYLCSGLTKGVWMREAIKLASKEKIEYDFSRRKIESKKEYLFRKIYIYSPFFMRKILDYIFN
ncbi:MAG: hypothetical protein N2449_09780 [Bacteroidales bacterium]|nr:hypothetical protein [Bacteroidales bacterium]